MISASVSQGSLKGLVKCPRAPIIHHLFFTDDSLLFGEASEEECHRYHTLLNLYERDSGQKINLQKSSVVFSRNGHPDVKANLATILGYNVWKSMIVI